MLKPEKHSNVVHVKGRAKKKLKKWDTFKMYNSVTSNFEVVWVLWGQLRAQNLTHSWSAREAFFYKKGKK